MTTYETWQALKRATSKVTWCMAECSRAAHEARGSNNLEQYQVLNAKSSRLQVARGRLINASGKWLDRWLAEAE